jgi:ribosomal-protein-alanine N-acetyltransferase
MLRTPRLDLVPATLDLARAEVEDRAAFGRLLSAEIPDDWPPRVLSEAPQWYLQQLEAGPELVGWLAWYGLLRSRELGSEILVASAGFWGPPWDGLAEISYAVLPRYQRRGLATEILRALVAWAGSQPGVKTVLAETAPDNLPSVRLLLRIGFTKIGPGVDPGHVQYGLSVAPSHNWCHVSLVSLGKPRGQGELGTSHALHC